MVRRSQRMFFYIAWCRQSTAVRRQQVTKAMSLNITFFKIITGALFALMLVSLGLLTFALVPREGQDTSFIPDSNIHIILFIAALLMTVFLFIRFNVNDLLTREKKLEDANRAQKLAEQQLRKLLDEEKDLNRLKSDFIRMASHEFRSPLTVMLSSAFLVKRYAELNNIEKVKAHVEKIRKSVDHLTTIISDCLCVSDIEEGNLEVKAGHIDLKKFMEDFCEDFAECTRPGQKIRYHHSGPRMITTDEFMIRNILSKLLTNAVKYSPENTMIDVSTVVDGTVHLVVSDSGIGIPKSEQKQLFDRFYRASNAEHVQGTGLGLYIIRHYAEMLGGSIAVSSEEGKGAEFHVTIRDLD